MTEVVVTLVSVPQVAPAQPVPDSAQLTPMLWESLETVAVKFWVSPVCRLTVGGAMETETAPATVTVIEAVAFLLESLTDVAVSVTVEGLGKDAGAVYVMAAPEALETEESVPHAAPLQPVPDNDQVTPFACGSLATLAVKF